MNGELRQPLRSVPTQYTWQKGRLAQLGERLPYKQEVACSSHAPPTERPAGNGGFLLARHLQFVLDARLWKRIWKREGGTRSESGRIEASSAPRPS